MNKISPELLKEIKSRPELKEAMKRYWMTSAQGGDYLSEQEATQAFEYFISANSEKKEPDGLIKMIECLGESFGNMEQHRIGMFMGTARVWLEGKTHQLIAMKKKVTEDMALMHESRRYNHIIDEIIKIIK